MTILRAPGYEENLRLYEAPLRRCPQCDAPMSKYNRWLFCHNCVRKNPSLAKWKTLKCRKNHEYLVVGTTPRGDCQKCANDRTEEARRIRNMPVHLPALGEAKAKAKKTWREIWIAIGKPKDIKAESIRYYQQYRDGRPKARCPRQRAQKIADYLGVTLGELIEKGDHEPAK